MSDEHHASLLADIAEEHYAEDEKDRAAQVLELAAATVRDRHDLEYEDMSQVFVVAVHPSDSTSYVTCVTGDEEKAISQRAAAEKQHGLGTAEIQVHEVQAR